MTPACLAIFYVIRGKQNFGLSDTTGHEMTIIHHKAAYVVEKRTCVNGFEP